MSLPVPRGVSAGTARSSMSPHSATSRRMRSPSGSVMTPSITSSVLAETAPTFTRRPAVTILTRTLFAVKHPPAMCVDVSLRSTRIIASPSGRLTRLIPRTIILIPVQTVRRLRRLPIRLLMRLQSGARMPLNTTRSVLIVPTSIQKPVVLITMRLPSAAITRLARLAV